LYDHDRRLREQTIKKMQRHDRNKCVFTEKSEEDEHKEVGIKMKRSEGRKYHFDNDGGRQLE